MTVWLIMLVFMLVLSVQFMSLIKEIKAIKKIKATLHDGTIRAVVIDTVSQISTSDIKPILQYTVAGIDKKYIYHFYYSRKQYPIGKEVTLRLSGSSGLAYDRTDLIKAFIYELGLTMFSAFCVIVCIIGLILGKYNLAVEEDMIKSYFLFFGSCLALLVILKGLVEAIKKFLKISADDTEIKATVVSIVTVVTGDIQPILLYNIDGATKTYTYHSSFPIDKYSVGDEVTLKFSEKNGFAYDKEDLIKELRTYLIVTIMMVLSALLFASNIWL